MSKKRGLSFIRHHLWKE